MLKQINQPFETQAIKDAISNVISQIKDLLTYAQTNYSESVYNQLFHSSETALDTELSDMYVDDLVSHLEYLITTRDAISHHIHTYQSELNARLAKLTRSVAAYVPVKSDVVVETVDDSVNTETPEAETITETVNTTADKPTQKRTADKPTQKKTKATD